MSLPPILRVISFAVEGIQDQTATWTSGQTTQPVRITNLPLLSSKLFVLIVVASYPPLKVVFYYDTHGRKRLNQMCISSLKTSLKKKGLQS